MSSPKYCLIEFEENESKRVGIVPWNWLKEDQGVCWWPHRNSSVAWVVNCRAPDASSGQYWPFTRILDRHDDYQKLRRAEEKSLENSDVNVSVTEVEEEEEEPFRRKRVISEIIRWSPEICRRGRERSWSPERSSSHRSRSRSPRSHTRRDRRSPSPPPPRVPPQAIFSRDTTAKLADSLAPYFERMHKGLAEINRRVSVIDNRVGRCEEMLRDIHGQAAAPVHPAQQAQPARPPPPALPQRQYPVEEKEDLVRLNSELAERDVRDRAVLFLSAIGGPTLKDSVNNILKWLLAPRLAFSYTLTGKVKTKGRLRDLSHLLDTVYEAARQRNANATLVELDGFTGLFLTRSCDRGGQKQEREARKQMEREANLQAHN